MRWMLAAALVVACSQSPKIDLGNETPVGLKPVAYVPSDPNLKIDILFVIDNSGSMAEEQASLAAWAQASLFGTLETEVGSLPDLHVALLSTNVGAGGYAIAQCEGNGDAGRFQNTPRDSCAGPVGSFIVDEPLPDGTRNRNYAGTIGDAFACIAPLGTDGCGLEQPLEAMRRALDATNPDSTAFLRDDALLMVVIVTDEDDCSASNAAVFDPSQTELDSPLGPRGSFRCFEFGVVCDEPDPRAPGPRTNCRPRDDSPYIGRVGEFVDFLTSRKTDPTQVMVTVISGEPTPILVETDAEGIPRLASVCPDLGPAMDAGPLGGEGIPDAGPDAGGPTGEECDGIDNDYDGLVDEGCDLLPTFSARAYPAVRLRAFLDSFPARNRFSSICAGSMEMALKTSARLAGRVAAAKPCLLGAVRDERPSEAGIQPTCRSFDAIAPRTEAERRTEIPSCAKTGGVGPCFQLRVDPALCEGTETTLAIDVVRTAPAEAGAHVLVECLAD